MDEGGNAALMRYEIHLVSWVMPIHGLRDPDDLVSGMEYRRILEDSALPQPAKDRKAASEPMEMFFMADLL